MDAVVELTSTTSPCFAVNTLLCASTNTRDVTRGESGTSCATEAMPISSPSGVNPAVCGNEKAAKSASMGITTELSPTTGRTDSAPTETNVSASTSRSSDHTPNHSHPPHSNKTTLPVSAEDTDGD